MAAPPRSSDGPSYTRPGTLYGRSATVYGRTVTDRDTPGHDAPGHDAPDHDAPDRNDDPAEDTGFLGFTAAASSGRHSASGADLDPLPGTLTDAGLPVVALGLALVALLIAGVATITGIMAVGRATSAQVAAERAASAAASAADGVRITPEQPASPQAVVPAPVLPSPTPSAPAPDPDRLDPKADYTTAYSAQLVRVQPSTCEGTGVDLDEPRVLPPTGADAAYRNCDDGYHLDFDEAARYAVVSGPRTTAGECVDAIRANPGVGWVSPTPGTTVCVLTSRLAAEPQNLTTKLALLHVENVEPDGTLVAALTGWVVP
ncbi:hypothetical protein [Cryptosporangium aurantiacum]|uniref:Uncharacterized protein n=1 Tax=Cryptosporangium aurantiacum TaxID=134849 RepID=A0A1M7K329_9ACTN|nr:hypothetical protein [Cryptosporangium aurantiacum]SHM59625.1 hypothetical protein SAMN05443668_101987 [Cryptosporangium aurantiacum]